MPPKTLIIGSWCGLLQVFVGHGDLEKIDAVAGDKIASLTGRFVGEIPIGVLEGGAVTTRIPSVNRHNRHRNICIEEVDHPFVIVVRTEVNTKFTIICKWLSRYARAL